MSQITGNFKREIFKSNSNGYLVGLFKVKDASNDMKKFLNKTITFTGILPDLNEMDTYVFDGNLVSHNKYGEQFEVLKFDRILPTEKDSMIDILSSEMFKGIGRKTAEKVVSVFHENTFDVILHKESDLLLVPGVNQKQVTALHDALLAYQGSYEVILTLTNMGFHTKDSMKIYHFYKQKTNEIIIKDLYQIFYDIEDLPFKLVDHIALSNHLMKDDCNRVKAAIIYIMRTLSTSYGHTYFLKEEITQFFERVLSVSVSSDKKEEAFTLLTKEERIVVRDNRIYLKEYYDAEIFIARRLRLLAHQEKEKIDHLDTIIEAIEKENEIVYNEEQKMAIKEALENKTLVITGGPGTGKTTIIKGILDAYIHLHQYGKKESENNIALLAPTGRASKRMSETSSFKAATIHRFLKWNKELDRFQINEYNKSEVSFVIVDEVSMLDCILLANLLKGLTSSTKIIFVGDTDQLPSVGPGEVLKDMISSSSLPVIALKNLYRQAQDSAIIHLAHSIRSGKLDPTTLENKKDLFFLPCSDDALLDTIEEICSHYSKDDIQILAPMYKTKNGIDAINQRLQALWNSKEGRKKELLAGEVTYREEDKVIQLSNMPDEFVFNGDIGKIIRMKTSGKKELFIDFDSNVVKYTPTMFSKFSLAYAISIHKSQGSEFDTVLIPLALGYHKMLYRKLIYTAVTRCKKKLILVGNIKALEMAILNSSEKMRRTSLAFYLKNGIL